MACPTPGGEEECTPEYGLYDGKQRFAADQVPMDFRKVFRRTAAKRGSKMVFGWKTLKAIEKRMATNFIFVRAEGPQPPLFLVLKGAPSRNPDGSYNTKIPSDPRLRKEAEEYKRLGVNVYWDPKFRTSHWVLIDAFRDFRAWLTTVGETREVVIQLDNLPEHCSVKFQRELHNLRIRPLYLPSNSTDVGSVVDYDIGRIEKQKIKKSFRGDFSSPTKCKFYLTHPRKGGCRGCPMELFED